jgi:hypothetical protein
MAGFDADDVEFEIDDTEIPTDGADFSIGDIVEDAIEWPALDEIVESVIIDTIGTGVPTETELNVLQRKLRSLPDVESATVELDGRDLDVDIAVESSPEVINTDVIVDSIQPKFAPCECDADEEKWEVVRSPRGELVPEGELTYECKTCITRYRPFGDE